jgi:hypothetical protein
VEVTAIVNRLEEQYGGTVKCEVKDATTEVNREEIKAYDLGNHGMVIFDAAGDIKWKKAGHSMTEPEITEVLERVLEGVQ